MFPWSSERSKETVDRAGEDRGAFSGSAVVILVRRRKRVMRMDVDVDVVGVVNFILS